MAFVKQFKNSLIAVLGIFALVFLLLLVGVIPYDEFIFGKFFVGASFLIIGQTVFLVTIDKSIIKIGRSVGSSLMKFKKPWIIIFFGFLFGLVSTVAEPDVQVLISELLDVNPFISSLLLISIFGIGAGLFVGLALIRILKNIKLKYILLVLYSIIFILAAFCPENYLGLAFDSGGVSTGAITVPFILSLVIGICAIKSGSTKDDNFGAAGIVSTGPIIAVLILGIIFGAPEGTYSYVPLNIPFFDMFFNQIKEVALALSPLILTFIVSQLTFLKLPAKQTIKILIGLLIAGIGLVFFLTGIYYGFSTMGTFIGEAITNTVADWFILVFGFLIGFVIIFTEPAVIVLVGQIEDVTAGFIKKKTVFIALAIGVALAVMLSFVHILYSISWWYFLFPFYALCIALNFVIPKIFMSIAFDGGGIASGTMSVAFILPICIGISEALGQEIMLSAFGVIGFVATIPIFTLQVLGLIYKLSKMKKERKLKKEKLLEEKLLKEQEQIQGQDLEQQQGKDLEQKQSKDLEQEQEQKQSKGLEQEQEQKLKKEKDKAKNKETQKEQEKPKTKQLEEQNEKELKEEKKQKDIKENKDAKQKARKEGTNETS
ncbi:MAG: DUF1538 family protein [Clostridia bacterium]|nr:DUF1538 family protein [Clostridia bacterium]